MHHVDFPSGQSTPALGMGTWRMGEESEETLAALDGIFPPPLRAMPVEML